MNRPLTKKEWLEFLEKACDEFDWSATHQQREWVGLTNEDIDKIRNTLTLTNFGIYTYARAIEAKLKEKNT